MPGTVATVIQEHAAVDATSGALRVDGCFALDLLSKESADKLLSGVAPQTAINAIASGRRTDRGYTFRSRSLQVAASETGGAAALLPETAWATLVEASGRKNVSSRLRLDVGLLREHEQQWQRRKKHDNDAKRLAGAAAVQAVQAVQATRRPPEATAPGPRSYLLELQTGDPYSFAFGGVYPGTLHAHGALRAVHRVSFSVGVAGDYLLHVRLRSQAAALPGSPFGLRVEPGPAYAHCMSLPASVMRSEVGAPCQAIIHAADRMGNVCQTGGCELFCSCTDASVEATCEDMGDGRYKVTWRSERPGSCEGAVKLGGEHVQNSPVQLTFTSMVPHWPHTEVSGIGFTDRLGSQVVVGELQQLRVRLRDLFLNNVTPSQAFKASIRIGMALPQRGSKGPKKPLAQSEMDSVAFEGGWSPTEPNEYEISFTPESEAIAEMHLWAQVGPHGERIVFPGSPFALSCAQSRSTLLRERREDKFDASGVLPGDYRIDPLIFDEAQKRWGSCSIDAFASKATKLVSRFWSAKRVSGDGGFLGVNAFAQPWEEGERIWVHAPLELSHEVVLKLKQADRLAEAIVCTATFRGTPWYIDLLMMSDDQIRFPRGQLERIAEDAPPRLDEWPITIFRVPAVDPATIEPELVPSRDTMDPE